MFNPKAHLERVLSLGILIWVLLACNLSDLPFMATKASQVPEEALPTYTSLPTYTPPPSQTPLPTYTFPSDALPITTITQTGFPPPPITLPPSMPTATAATWGVLVRIRNWTNDKINLYRYGRSGEIHFLGWLSPKYYGEYRFPSLGEWMIAYCKRDVKGESYDCKKKKINVTQDNQTFAVP